MNIVPSLAEANLTRPNTRRHKNSDGGQWKLETFAVRFSSVMRNMDACGVHLGAGELRFSDYHLAQLAAALPENLLQLQLSFWKLGRETANPRL